MDTAKEFLSPTLIWFVIGLTLLLVEFSLPGLIVFFFGIGAWVVALVCYFSDISLNWQLALFLITSVLLLASLRKWVRTIFIGRLAAKEYKDEFIGGKAVVTRDIAGGMAGKVEFHGASWNAEADGDIGAGTPVEIIGKDNLTLKVRPLKRG